MIKVLVVDDSAFMRKMVCEILDRDPEISIVGTARDGAEALVKVKSLQPDVVTLDVEMPVLDGYGALKEIMHSHPLPVVMLSSLTQGGAEATLRCLELGAVDFIGKPSGSISLDIEKVSGELVTKVKAAAKARLRRAVSSAISSAVSALPASVRRPVSPPSVVSAAPAPLSVPPAPRPREGGRSSAGGVLVIGASTGGPRALQTLVPALPAGLAMPIVIVQHMPPGFTGSLAHRLQESSAFEVREAIDGDLLRVGRILVAPGGKHLEFDTNGAARLSEAPTVHGVRPSVDVTLASLTRLYGARLVAVLLTGMGRDGARGLKTIHDLGGKTFAEDESTCTVYGMPKAAVELNGVGCLLPLPEIAPALALL